MNNLIKSRVFNVVMYSLLRRSTKLRSRVTFNGHLGQPIRRALVKACQSFVIKRGTEHTWENRSAPSIRRVVVLVTVRVFCCGETNSEGSFRTETFLIRINDEKRTDERCSVLSKILTFLRPQPS